MLRSISGDRPKTLNWQRLCFVCMLNAHELWRLQQLQSRIADVSSFDKWKHLLNDEAEAADNPVPLLQPPKRNRRLFFLTEDDW
ncbi:unnamed protein product (mitochondrion) [Plasmodiophora brassicae]|uniref:Uncharacterized protein n=1 Tax=Plasmodiophora brassicae TaxID=37360 RepID=A0A3P3YHE4_PLABS|nr:unnamed protein product [Plasmodiophora brassicae]